MIFNVCFLAKSHSIEWCDLVNTSVNAFLSAYLHLFLRPKGAVLTAFLVKLFRFWSHIICPPPSPAQFVSQGLSNSQKLVSTLCRQLKITSMIMQWNFALSSPLWYNPHSHRTHFKLLMTATICRTFSWYCLVRRKRWFWIQSLWIKWCLYLRRFVSYRRIWHWNDKNNNKEKINISCV